jgi:hypothetical protein
MRNFVTGEGYNGSHYAEAHETVCFGATREAAMRSLRRRIEVRMMDIEGVPVAKFISQLDRLNSSVTDLDMELDRCLKTTPSASSLVL